MSLIGNVARDVARGVIGNAILKRVSPVADKALDAATEKAGKAFDVAKEWSTAQFVEGKTLLSDAGKRHERAMETSRELDASCDAYLDACAKAHPKSAKTELAEMKNTLERYIDAHTNPVSRLILNIPTEIQEAVAEVMTLITTPKRAEGEGVKNSPDHLAALREARRHRDDIVEMLTPEKMPPNYGVVAASVMVTRVSEAFREVGRP